MADPFDYIESKEDADELIADFGQAAVLVVPGTPTGPGYAPTPGVPVRKDCMIAVVDYSNRQIDGTRILESDQRGLLAVGDLDVVPSPTHKLELKDRDGNALPLLTIIKVKPLAPGGVTVLYDIQMRRA